MEPVPPGRREAFLHTKYVWVMTYQITPYLGSMRWFVLRKLIGIQYQGSFHLQPMTRNYTCLFTDGLVTASQSHLSSSSLSQYRFMFASRWAWWTGSERPACSAHRKTAQKRSGNALMISLKNTAFIWAIIIFERCEKRRHSFPAIRRW